MAYWSATYPATVDYLKGLRRFMRGMLRDVPGTNDVVQIASELAANAILHTASGEEGGTFTLHLATFSDHWHVRVDDQGGPNMPTVQPSAEATADAGRGLAVVAALSSAWGVLGDEYGRAVWAEIPFPDSEAHHG